MENKNNKSQEENRKFEEEYKNEIKSIFEELKIPDIDLSISNKNYDQSLINKINEYLNKDIEEQEKMIKNLENIKNKLNEK